MGGEWLHLEMVYDNIMHCWYNNVPICTLGIVLCRGPLCVWICYQIVEAYVGLR